MSRSSVQAPPPASGYLGGEGSGFGVRSALAGLSLLLLTGLVGRAQPGNARPAPAPPATSSFYLPAFPGYQFSFPRDHAAHPEYQTEWWYYTGHLASGSRRFGYELTFFQVGIDPRRKASKSAWALHTLYFAHLALTDENGRRFQFTENVSRPALGMAGSETGRYHVWIHDWSARLAADGKTHDLAAVAPDLGIALDLTPRKPPVVHGQDGIVEKGSGIGQASHYYSMTRLETRGTLTVRGEKLPVTGTSWMDHEFGSNQLSPEVAGWDWFSIQLDDGRELMLYLLRLKFGGIEPASSGTLVNADGTPKHLPLSAFATAATGTWNSPRSGAEYPAGWTVRVPGEGMDLRLTPAVPDQELEFGGTTGVAYWEGSVRVQGRDRGRSVKGDGYVELTGYAGGVPGI